MHTIVAGEPVLLLPQRALYWPAQKLLVIADIHFGKAASFRAKGVPVPHGTTTENLEALDALLGAQDVSHLLFLGDFFHAKAAHAPRTLDGIRAWRARYAHLALTLVRGNHDSHAGDPPADLQIDVVDEPYRIGPFAFCHHPQQCDGAYVLAGHVHPVYRLAARGDALRMPCFVVGKRHALLPSFGAFTGGHPVVPESGEEIFVTVGEKTFRIPTVRA
jgi:DNA ligase-associated metallophosphoesterase